MINIKKPTKIIFLLSLLFLNSMSPSKKPEFIARYLISLTRYIEWPNAKDQHIFTIGVVGDFSVYKSIAEETMSTGIQSKNVDVMNLVKLEQAGDANLNILILSENYCSPENIRKAVKIIGSKPTLLITEKPNALNYGSAINFLVENNKLEFEINKTNSRRNNIKISNQIDVFATNIE